MKVKNIKVSLFLVIFAFGITMGSMYLSTAVVPLAGDSEQEYPQSMLVQTAAASGGSGSTGGTTSIPPYLTVDASLLYPTSDNFVYIENTKSPDTAQVTLTVTGLGDQVGGRVPLDIVLAIDSSGSMQSYDPSGIRKTASKNLVDQLNSSWDQVGIVAWSNGATSTDFVLALTNNFPNVKTSIDAISDDGYATNMNLALTKSINLLDTGSRVGTARVIIFLTDGLHNYPNSTFDYSNVNTAAEKGYIIYTIGLGNQVNQVLMRNIANATGGAYYHADNASVLIPIFNEIANQVSTIAGANIHVTEILADNIHYADSATIAPTVSGQSLLWNIGSVSINQTWSVTFSIKGAVAGLLPVSLFPDSTLDYISYNQTAVSLPIPQLQVQVKSPNEPPVAVIGGPYVGIEGSAITFDASGSSDDGEIAPLSYRWDFNNDGVWDTPYSFDFTATNTWFDDYTGIIVVEVYDGEFATIDSTTVEVNNVAPTVAIDDIASAQLLLSVISFTGKALDPGADDVTFAWDWGDGTTSTAFYANAGAPVDITEVAAHAYLAPGNYTVTLTVTDDDLGVGADTTQVTVLGARDLKASAITLLKTLETGNKCNDHYVKAIICHIQASLDNKLWLNSTHLSSKWGHKVFDYEFSAAALMEAKVHSYTHAIPKLEWTIAKLEAKGCNPVHMKAELAFMQQAVVVYEEAMQLLVQADELIVKVALADAQSVVVQCPKLQHKVDCLLTQAIDEMEDAANFATIGRYPFAIHEYKDAWEITQCVLKIASQDCHCCGGHHHHPCPEPKPQPHHGCGK